MKGTNQRDWTLLKTENNCLCAPPALEALKQALAGAPEEIREAVRAAGTTDKEGRPVAEGLEEVARAKGEPVVIIPLGAEEPFFLEGLLVHCAGWLAAGVALACRAVPGAECLVYGGEADTAALRSLLAQDPPGAGLSFLTGPTSVVLREESALYAVMAGKPLRSELLEKPFPLAGWEGRPTLILDAETACWLAAAMLLPGRPQGKLVAAQAHTSAGGTLREVGATTLAQFPLDIPLGGVTDALALPTARPLLLGGPGGQFADAASGNAAVGYNHGFDTLRGYDESCCMADVGLALTARAAGLSCGKCVLCREGSWQLSAIFGDIVAGRGKRTDFDLVTDIGALIAIGAFCDFGRRMVRPAMGLVSLCKPELEAHVVRKTCPAGVCARFSSYVIDPKLCTGCGECLDACEFDAIEGKDGYIHMIDEDCCEKCGKCAGACEQGAARLAAGKIKLPKKLVRVGAFK